MDVLKGSSSPKFVDSNKTILNYSSKVVVVNPTNEATAAAAAGGGGTGVNNDGIISAIQLMAAFDGDSGRTAGGGGEHQDVHVGESNS